MKKYFWAIFLGYAAEIILAGLIFLALLLFLGSSAVSGFISEIASEFSKLAFAIFAASLTVWGLFFNFSKPESQFGSWMNEKGADKVFHYAFVTSIVVNLIASILFVISSKYKSQYVTIPSAFFGILAILNLYSLIKNAWDLINLSYEFKKIGKK